MQSLVFLAYFFQKLSKKIQPTPLPLVKEGLIILTKLQNFIEFNWGMMSY